MKNILSTLGFNPSIFRHEVGRATYCDARDLFEKVLKSPLYIYVLYTSTRGNSSRLRLPCITLLLLSNIYIGQKVKHADAL